MEISRNDVWHILQVMKDRGTSHCQECADIKKRLNDAYVGVSE